MTSPLHPPVVAVFDVAHDRLGDLQTALEAAGCQMVTGRLSDFQSPVALATFLADCAAQAVLYDIPHPAQDHLPAFDRLCEAADDSGCEVIVTSLQRADVEGYMGPHQTEERTALAPDINAAVQAIRRVLDIPAE